VKLDFLGILADKVNQVCLGRLGQRAKMERRVFLESLGSKVLWEMQDFKEHQVRLVQLDSQE